MKEYEEKVKSTNKKALALISEFLESGDVSEQNKINSIQAICNRAIKAVEAFTSNQGDFDL